MIKFKCPECGSIRNLQDNAVGKMFKCTCGAVSLVSKPPPPTPKSPPATSQRAWDGTTQLPHDNAPRGLSQFEKSLKQKKKDAELAAEIRSEKAKTEKNKKTLFLTGGVFAGLTLAAALTCCCMSSIGIYFFGPYKTFQDGDVTVAIWDWGFGSGTVKLEVDGKGYMTGRWRKDESAVLGFTVKDVEVKLESLPQTDRTKTEAVVLLGAIVQSYLDGNLGDSLDNRLPGL